MQDNKNESRFLLIRDDGEKLVPLMNIEDDDRMNAIIFLANYIAEQNDEILKLMRGKE